LTLKISHTAITNASIPTIIKIINSLIIIGFIGLLLVDFCPAPEFDPPVLFLGGSLFVCGLPNMFRLKLGS
jgi:hypothetical protein